MEKKKYNKPITETTLELSTPILLAGSINSNEGITGGGKDENGTLNPEAKPYSIALSHRNVWED